MRPYKGLIAIPVAILGSLGLGLPILVAASTKPSYQPVPAMFAASGVLLFGHGGASHSCHAQSRRRTYREYP